MSSRPPQTRPARLLGPRIGPRRPSPAARRAWAWPSGRASCSRRGAAAPEDDRAARPETCVFCKKVAEAENNPSAFAYVDAEIVVFRDWKPAARAHFLVCPREHITSARALTPADAGLARRMLEVGERVVDDAKEKREDGAPVSNEETTRFGTTSRRSTAWTTCTCTRSRSRSEPAWKERKYSVEPWARFAFEPAGETAQRLERARRATPRL